MPPEGVIHSSRANPSKPSGSLGVTFGVAAWLGIGALVAFAYGGLLDAWFDPVDDALHLAGVVRGSYPSPHFRPAHFIWNRALFGLVGHDAGAWHAASLGLHALTALALVALARGAGAGRCAALVAGGVGATLFAPHEAVAWIAAVCGQLSIGFVVLAGLGWTRFLAARAEQRSGPARVGYAVALSGLVLGMLSKEDCVLAGPLLIGLELARNGWRATLRRGPLLAYLPFAALGLYYLSLAFDPSLWAEREGVGTYALGAESVPRLFGNLALLFWPKRVPQELLPAWAPWAGAALAFGISGCARCVRKRSPQTSGLLWLGLALAVAGLLPVLPGPWPVVASTRYGYASLPGAALLAAGAFQLAAGDLAQAGPGRTGRLTGRTGLVAALALAWCLAHASSVRSSTAWRFVERSVNYERLVRATLDALPPDGVRGPDGWVLLVAPPVWSPTEICHVPVAFGPPSAVRGHVVELPEDDLTVSLGRWGERARVRVFENEQWVPLDPEALARFSLRDAQRTGADANVMRTPGTVPACLFGGGATSVDCPAR